VLHWTCTVSGFKSLFEFESALAKYTGSPYAVVTDCCTHAIELCMRYDQVKECEFTAYTYLSIPMVMHQLNIKYKLVNHAWAGEYQFVGTRIWDSARRLEPGMYQSGQMQCLSFGRTKPLELGRMGAILLDDVEAYDQLSMMRSDGRNLRISPWQDQISFRQGYHYCPTLEICELGIQKLAIHQPQCQSAVYPDCREILIKS
jgi:dTDP-4-amino-4,6-dideoxygalactose transaminase